MTTNDADVEHVAPYLAPVVLLEELVPDMHRNIHTREGPNLVGQATGCLRTILRMERLRAEQVQEISARLRALHQDKAALGAPEVRETRGKFLLAQRRLAHEARGAQLSGSISDAHGDPNMACG